MLQQSLEKIDTSYWLTKDKDWMANRKDSWSSIEKMLPDITKKGQTIIKQYYLRGKMPNWQALKEWDNNRRHLNLLYFLWLHPSDDEQVLFTLYREYMMSELIHNRDAFLGYGTLLSSQIGNTSMGYTHMDECDFPQLGDKGLVIFNILFKDVGFANARLCNQLKTQNIHSLVMPNIEGYQSLHTMRKWLSLEVILPVHQTWLLQFEEPLELWYEQCSKEADNYFNDEKISYDRGLARKNGGYKCLYCFYHFDIEKEGDTCRSRFVIKLRKMLNERDFSPEFKAMWADIKADKVEVDDPWRW